MDWDEFQDWDRRGSLGAGVGYLAVDQDALKLRLRAGLNAAREWGASNADDNRWRPEALAGAELNWKINETNTFDAKAIVYPDLRDSGKYRVLSEAGWSIKLAKDSGLSLKLGVADEYDTHREAPFKKNDLRFFAALLYEF